MKFKCVQRHELETEEGEQAGGHLQIIRADANDLRVTGGVRFQKTEDELRLERAGSHSDLF